MNQLIPTGKIYARGKRLRSEQEGLVMSRMLLAVRPGKELNDPELLRRYAVGLWLDVYLLQLSIGVVRGRYAELVTAAERAVATAPAAGVAALRRQLELAIDDPDVPVSYTLTERAGRALDSGIAGRSSQ